LQVVESGVPVSQDDEVPDPGRTVPMSSDLDLPLLPSAEQIRRREFASVRRGYDPDQVRQYLTAVAAQVEALEKELHAERPGTTSGEPAPSGIESIAAPPASDPYEELGKRVATLSPPAAGGATRRVDAAPAAAARMLTAGRAEADRIRLDAQARAEEARQEGADALEKAKIEAERTLSNLSTKREDLVNHLHEMQSRLLSVAQDLESTIEERDAGAAAWASRGADATAEPATEPVTAEPTKPQEPGPPDAGDADETQSVGAGADIVDPRYEDLWVSTETVELPQLTTIDFDFDDDNPDPKG
jgi:DivIVA domain-containing protein